MSRAVDVQQAINELSEHLFEVRQAVVFLGAHLGSQLADREKLVGRLRAMANLAGQQLSKEAGCEHRDNPVLINIAELLEAPGAGLAVIQGGKQDDPEGPDAA